MQHVKATILGCVISVVAFNPFSPIGQARTYRFANSLSRSARQRSPIFQRQEVSRENSSEAMLLQHLLQHGGGSSVHAEVVHGLRGLVADRDVDVGDVLLEVPLALTISDIDDNGSALLAGSAPVWTRKLPWVSQLVISVVGRTSDDPYLRTWPSKSLPLPHRCESDKLELLSDRFVQTKVDEDYFRLDSLYWEAREAYDAGVDSNDMTAYKSFPSFEDFSDAFEHVTSRSLRLSSGQYGTRRLLVPYLDLANHEAKPTALFDYSSCAVGGPAIRLYAVRPVKAGDQITISYCDESNEHFALYYGFVPESNPNNAIVVTLADILSVLPQSVIFDQPTEELLEKRFNLYGDGVDFDLFQTLARFVLPGKSAQGMAARAVARLSEAIEKSSYFNSVKNGEEAVGIDEALLSTPGALTEEEAILIKLRLSRRRLLISLRRIMLHDAQVYDASPHEAEHALLDRVEAANSRRTPFPMVTVADLEVWNSRTWNWSSAGW